jgi:hypothetical protein
MAARLATLVRHGDVLASGHPGRPLAANLVFVAMVAVLELFGREEVIAAGASASQEVPPLLAWLLVGLWLLYPWALHIKLPLIAETSAAGREGRLIEGWEPTLLVFSLLMSMFIAIVVMHALGFGFDDPLAPLFMFPGAVHGLTVTFLFIYHLGRPPPVLAGRRRWEWLADLLLIAYVVLVYAWVWEGMMVARGMNLAGLGWPAVLPRLLAVVVMFWLIYFPLQAPFLLGYGGRVARTRGGAWRFRASCLLATVAGVWPAL